MLTKRSFAALAVAAIAFAACGGSTRQADDNTGGNGGVAPSDCGFDAYTNATKPVEVTFWHAMTRENADWLAQTTKEFNASHPDVHVTLTQFPSYQDLLTKYLAGLSTKDLPDVFQPEDTTVQRMIDSQSVVPVQACVDADHYSLDPLLPRVKAYFSYKNVLYGMPWSISNPILWYNANRVHQGRTRPEQASEDPRAGQGVLAEDRCERCGEARHRAARRAVHLRVPQRQVGWNAREQCQWARRPRDRGDARDRDRQHNLGVVEGHGGQRPRAQHRRRDREHRPHARGRQRQRGHDNGGERCARHCEAGPRVGPVQHGQDRNRAAALDQRRWWCSGGRRVAVDQQVGGARKARGGLAVHQVSRVRPRAGVAGGRRRLRADPLRRDEACRNSRSVGAPSRSTA